MMDAFSEHADRFDFDAERASLIEADDAIKASEGRRRDYGAWRTALAVARAFQ